MPIILALLGCPQKPSPKPCVWALHCVRSTTNLCLFLSFWRFPFVHFVDGFFKSHLCWNVSSHGSHWSSCFQISNNPRPWVQYVWCDIARGQRKHFSRNEAKKQPRAQPEGGSGADQLERMLTSTGQTRGGALWSEGSENRECLEEIVHALNLGQTKWITRESVRDLTIYS